MEKLKSLTPIKLVIIIMLAGILVALVILLVGFIQGSARDSERSSFADSVVSANEEFWKKNSDYAADIGDSTAECEGAKVNTLVGAGVLECPKIKARKDEEDVTWDEVYEYQNSAHWSMATGLEWAEDLTCTKDGCE